MTNALTGLSGLSGLGIGGGALSPILTRLKFWLDGDDPLTRYQDSTLTTLALLDADPVGGWKDKSGYDRHATIATGSKRPTLKLAVQGGRAAVLGDGVDDELWTPVFTISQPYTIYLAYKCPESTHKAIFYSRDANVGFRHYSADDGGLPLIYNGGSATFPTLGTAFLIATMVVDGVSTVLRKNGVVQTMTGSPGSGALTGGIGLFALATYGIFFTPVHIGEMLVYDGADDASTIAANETYLNTKWVM